jgi:hypothetical protein
MAGCIGTPPIDAPHGTNPGPSARAYLSGGRVDPLPEEVARQKRHLDVESAVTGRA